MSVAFPTGYNMERSSPIAHDLNADYDEMSDGSGQIRVRGADTFEKIGYQTKYMEGADKDALLSFLKTNRAEDITWTIDDIDYFGNIVVSVDPIETMSGNLYNLNFTLRGKVV